MQHYMKIDINHIFTPESNIHLMTDMAIETNETGNSLDLYMRLKALNESIEEALKILHPSAMNIASREREYMGFSLSVVAKKSYSYEDPVIAELEEKIKKRKELARQALSLGIETIIVQETGEIVPAAIVTGSSEYIKRGNAIPLESENPTINHKKKKGSI